MSESLIKLCVPQFTIEGGEEVLNTLNITREDCLELAGGIPVVDDFKLGCSIFIKSPNHISVTVDSSIYWAQRSFFFGHGIISNDNLRVFSERQGTGRLIFNAQLTAARKHHFKRINLWAAGGDISDGFNGHYTWGRVGFSMKEDQLASFNKWKAVYSCEGDNLFEMLKIEENKEKWLKNGFSWRGYFLTDPRSENSKNFAEYLRGN